MEQEELRKKIKEILEFVDTLPEPYREKTYEILLSKVILGDKSPTAEITEKVSPASDFTEFIIPIDVRVFLTKYEISEDIIPKLFLISGSEIRLIFKLTTTKKKTAVIQLTVLKALENALKGGKFEFAIEEIRQLAIEYKCYDASNFMKVFKTPPSNAFFKDLEDLEHVQLSPDGKAELAEIILEIAS